MKTEDSDFKPLPFPVNFWFYDVNMDGQITLGELIETTGDAEDVKKAFAASDRNSKYCELCEITILNLTLSQTTNFRLFPNQKSLQTTISILIKVAEMSPNG